MNTISTITSLYRGYKYLPIFLKELSEQSKFDELQIVIAHNEPTEEELGSILAFKSQHTDNFIKHIILNSVEPLYTSWNRCIKEADGKYVAIWNIDDLRTFDGLQKQAEFLDNNPDYDIVHGNFVITNQFGSKQGKLIDHSHTLSNPEELKKGMYLGPFFMFRKEIVNKIGYFDEQFKSGADFDFAIRAANAGLKIGMAHGILGYYLDEQKGLSTRGDGVQPIERTLVEMRYGNKILEEKYVPLVAQRGYNVDKMINFGKELEISRSK